MVTIQEIEQREKELKETEQEAQKYIKEPIPIRRFGSRITPAQQQAVISRRQQAQQILIQVKEQKETLKEAKTQIKEQQQTQSQINELKRQEQQYQYGYRLGLSGTAPIGLSKEAREGYKVATRQLQTSTQRTERQQQLAKLEAEGLKPVYIGEKIVGFEDIQRGQSIGITEIKNLPIKDLERYEKAGVLSITYEKTSKIELTPQEKLNLIVTTKWAETKQSIYIPSQTMPLSYISKVENEKLNIQNLYGTNIYLSKKQQELLTKASRGKGTIITQATLTGIGFIKPFTQTTEALLHPIRTSRQIVYSTTHPIQSILALQKSLSVEARINPSGFTGEILGTITLIKLPEVIVKTSDIIRTRNLLELEKTEIIAPEYFKGQIYPQIKKGQTAGQLLKEFKPIDLKPMDLRGFTAVSKPYKSETIALKGSSELPGVYQAPKLSPTFLRISGEQKFIFSLKPFPTFRPTAIKIQPIDYKLISGLSAEQKSLVSLSKAKKFFYGEAKPGYSYVPFIKFEKEAIIPAGTLLKRTGKRFYFKFEGRKVPIHEYKTIGFKPILKQSELKIIGGYLKDLYEIPGRITSYDISVTYPKNIKYPKLVKTPEEFLGLGKYKVSAEPLEKITIPTQELISYSKIKPVSLPSYTISYPSSFLKPIKSSYLEVKPSYSKIIPSKSYPSISLSSYIPSSYIKTPRSPSIAPPPSKIPSISPPPKTPSLTYPPLVPTKAPPILKIPKFPHKRTKKPKAVPGYRPYVIKKGEKVYLGEILPRGEAIFKGEEEAKKTLRATFGIEPTKTKVPAGQLEDYTPSRKLFRGFRIQKGKKIPLKDTFIQKRGKRLTFPGEIREIQIARRLKL